MKHYKTQIKIGLILLAVSIVLTVITSAAPTPSKSAYMEIFEFGAGKIKVAGFYPGIEEWPAAKEIILGPSGKGVKYDHIIQPINKLAANGWQVKQVYQKSMIPNNNQLQLVYLLEKQF